ncbi:MAG: hypothetical protein HN769_12805 [Anaerolineae bacterium]|nr:hypothetical protein [Anaerolineae bacterium]
MQRQQKHISAGRKKQGQFEFYKEAEKQNSALSSDIPRKVLGIHTLWDRDEIAKKKTKDAKEVEAFEACAAGAGPDPMTRVPERLAERGGAPRSRLDKKDNNSIREEWEPEKVFVVAASCQCGLCPKCGPRIGGEVREVLLGKKGEFRRAALLTLTVDLAGTTTGKGFESPHAAFKAVNKGQYIATLLKLMGLPKWVRVVEFQKNGNPHWHVLLDLPFKYNIQKARTLAWKKWRDDWGIGGVDLGTGKKGRDQFNDPEHAINYITKYLTKPEDELPVWVMEMGTLRKVQGSKAIGPLRRKQSKSRPAKFEEEIEKADKAASLSVEVKSRTILDRISSCGNKFHILEAEQDGENTLRPSKWRATEEGSVRDAYEAVNDGTLEGLRITSCLREHKEGEYFQGYVIEGIGAKDKLQAWSRRREMKIKIKLRERRVKGNYKKDYQKAAAEAKAQKGIGEIPVYSYWSPPLTGSDRGMTLDEIIAAKGL